MKERPAVDRGLIITHSYKHLHCKQSVYWYVSQYSVFS